MSEVAGKGEARGKLGLKAITEGFTLVPQLTCSKLFSSIDWGKKGDS